MKITNLTTFVVGNPWKNWVFLELHTDEGITGLGEATGGLTTMTNEAELRELRNLLIGHDPRNPRAIWLHLQKSLYFRSSPAVAGIEMACWDILGKSLNAPVWQLLGGKTNGRLRAYANGWYSGERTPQSIADRAKEVVSLGFTALKFDPFGTAYKSLPRGDFREAMSLVEAVRGAVGDDVDILIEAHDRFTVPTAIEIGRALEPFAPFWFEAPTDSEDVAAVLAVARNVPVRVAAGERFHRTADFADLMHDRTIDIVQPELLNCGGVQGLLSAAAVADAFGGFVAPHNAQSPFTTVVNAHVGVAIPNLIFQETFDPFLVPWSRDIMTGHSEFRDGYIELPNGPGFGVTFDTEEMARHPYSERNFLRLFSSGWERREGDR